VEVSFLLARNACMKCYVIFLIGSAIILLLPYLFRVCDCYCLFKTYFLGNKIFIVYSVFVSHKIF